MTKAELQIDRDEWKQQAESLEEELYMLNEAYSELENENYELSNNINGYGIKDLEDFIFRLKTENLYTDRFESFLENYLRFHNK